MLSFQCCFVSLVYINYYWITLGICFLSNTTFIVYLSFSSYLSIIICHLAKQFNSIVFFLFLYLFFLCVCV